MRRDLSGCDTLWFRHLGTGSERATCTKFRGKSGGNSHEHPYRNTLCNLCKYSLHFGQIHLAIWTNTSWRKSRSPGGNSHKHPSPISRGRKFGFIGFICQMLKKGLTILTTYFLISFIFLQNQNQSVC